MSNRLMAAIWRLIIPIPPMLWHKQVSGMRKKIARELAFMTDPQVVGGLVYPSAVATLSVL